MPSFPPRVSLLSGRPLRSCLRRSPARLSISGSGWNRFKKAPTPAIFWGPHLAASLHLPNDMIVEDRSVDLSQSILQDELLSHPSEKYLHVRVYRDCTDVIHATMYNHGKIRDILVHCVTQI